MLRADALSRRTVLRTATAATATAALGPLAAVGEASEAQGTERVAPPKPIELPPLTVSTERKAAPAPAPYPPRGRVGFALVGLGHLTLQELLPAIAGTERCRVTALVTGDRAKGLEVARQYGVPESGVYTYAEYDRLRDNPDVQAIYVVLPNSMHEEYVVRGAKAGKHILCEKPMATSSAEARRMIDACKAANRKLMIAYRIQYEPNHRLLHDWTRAQRYGPVRTIDAWNGQNEAKDDQWRHKLALAGGGALPDIGLYNLNTIRWLLGEEPIEVSGLIRSTPGDPRFREVEETCVWRMSFPSGVVATCGTNYSSHRSTRYRVYADRGWYGMDPAFDYQGLRMELAYAEDDVEYRQNPSRGAFNQFAREMDHFAECVMEDKLPNTPGEEGLQDHLIMEAIYRSARENKPVKLPLVAGRDPFRHPESVAKMGA